MNIKKTVVYISIILNIIFILGTLVFLQQKGGMQYVVNKFNNNKKTNLKGGGRVFHFLPSVEDRVLFLGDSHLAIQPWNELTNINYSNRAVSGDKISDVNINKIKGNPAAIVLSIGTNDLQMGYNLNQTTQNLRKLLQSIKEKWRDSIYIYVSPPAPNVKLYENIIRPKYPGIKRPSPKALDALARCAKDEKFYVLYAESALTDGLHIDSESAKKIAQEIEKILADKSFNRTR